MLVYVIILFFSDINKISQQFMKIKFELIVPILIIEFLSLLLRSIRQQQFLRNIGITLSFVINLKIYIASLAAVATPAGGGQVIKSQLMKRNYGHSNSKTLPVILFERFHDLLAVFFIIAVSLLFSYNWLSMLIVVISSLLLITLFTIFRSSHFFIRITNYFLKFKFFQKFIPGPELNTSITSLSRSRPMILGFIISLGSWILDATAVYIGFLAFGQNLDFLKVMQFYFTSIAYGSLSFLPGGIGVTEGSFLGLLTATGLSISLSTSLVIFSRITTIWFATILGFISTHFIIIGKRYNSKKSNE